MSEAFIPGGSGSVNVKKSYGASFGTLPDETVYSDPFGFLTGQPTDLRPEIAKAYEPIYQALDERMADGETFRSASQEVAKALSTSDLTLPVFPQENLTMLATQRTPFWEALPKVTAETNTVDQDSVTDLGGAEVGSESGIPSSDADDTFQTQSLSMTYWRIRGAVTGPMQLAASSLRNSMAGEQQRKSMAMRHFGENLALNGDPVGGTTDGTLNDERAFKGVRTLATDNGQNRSPDAGTGTTITVEEVRENHRLAAEDGGDAGALMNITDLKTLTDLKNQLDDHDPVEVDAGENVVSLGARGVVIDDTPTVVSDFMPNSADSREFLTLDMRYHRVHNLSDMVMEALGKTQDADEFFMKQYGVLEQAAGADKYTALLENLA